MSVLCRLAKYLKIFFSGCFHISDFLYCHVLKLNVKSKKFNWENIFQLITMYISSHFIIFGYSVLLWITSKLLRYVIHPYEVISIVPWTICTRNILAWNRFTPVHLRNHHRKLLPLPYTFHSFYLSMSNIRF